MGGAAFRSKCTCRSTPAYSVEELALDDLFVWWVHQPGDDEVAAFWENFRDANPATCATLDVARRLVLAASTPPRRRLSASEAEALRERIGKSLWQLSARR